MKLYLRVLRLAGAQIVSIAAASALILAGTLADLALLGLLKRFVDDGLLARSLELTRSLALVALGLALLREIASYAGHRLTGQTTVRLVGDLQERLFAHIHRMPLAFFARHSPGDLVARVYHDVTAATHLVTGATASGLESPARLVGLFLVVWSLHPRLALWAAGVLVPLALATRLLGRSFRKRARAINDELGRLYDRTHESFASAEMSRSFGAEATEIAAFVTANRGYMDRQQSLIRLQAIESPIAQMLKFAFLVAAFAYGGEEIAAGRLSPGALTAILVAAYAFLGSLQALVSVASFAQTGLASAERVFEILDETPSLPVVPGAAPATFRRALRFESVTFAYPGRPPTLENVSFEIRPGECLGFVGPTGSGKTTLLRLALRLMDPTSGRVTLDGRDLRELDPASVRSLFTVVPQDAFLLDRSLGENVAYARPDAANADVRRAVDVAGLSTLVASLPQGLGTAVGASGRALSGGERQRVAVARAIVREAPILILDEATNALDRETEAAVRDGLSRAAKGRTLLVVSHHAAALANVDRILVLADGSLQEPLRSGVESTVARG